MNNIEFMYNRHSVRKYTNEEVTLEDIKKILEAATQCASAKNTQNWHFVIVKNSEKVKAIAKAIEDKNAQIASELEEGSMKDSFTKFVRFATVFKNAPITVLVYTSDYEPTGLTELKELVGYEKDLKHIIKMSPQMQSMGALIQSMLLVATELGYGGCWITSGNYAATEISEVVNFKENGFSLAAIVPIGVPQLPIKSPKRKGIDEVITVI